MYVCGCTVNWTTKVPRSCTSPATTGAKRRRSCSLVAELLSTMLTEAGATLLFLDSQHDMQRWRGCLPDRSAVDQAN